LPLTDSTRGIVNRQNLQKLQTGKDGAYLVNVARGGHVVEADLLAAVREGQVAGATLDVFEHEPLASDHPFWQEPRISITPHISALSLHQDTILQVRDKIHALEQGNSVNGVVDRSKGY
jgi:glyoxylate/hydroxypyruvate reductase A